MQPFTVIVAYTICVYGLWLLDRAYSVHWSRGFRILLWVVGLFASVPVSVILAGWLATYFGNSLPGGT